MSEMIESTDPVLPTVSVWTPWGEQKVGKGDSRAATLRRAAARLRASEELPSVPDFSERPWPVA